MIQMDMFNSSKEDYLFLQIQKVENSMDRRTKSLFGLVGELQNAIMDLKAQVAKQEK